MDITHQEIQTNGVQLHVAALGPEDGPLVILLHGFPEYWGAWEVHMRLLAEHGYRVIAPDQRGYGESEKPPRIKDYQLDALAGDIVGLIDHFGRQQARVVGHDWGGAVAWHLAQVHGDRLEQLAVINCPPADVMQRYLLRHPGQLLRSWYMMAMQWPYLMEWSVSCCGFKLLKRTMTSSANTGIFDDPKLAGHLAAWSQPRALRSMINWYRAAFWHPPKPAEGPIEVPTLLLWGEGDRFLSQGLVAPSIESCRDGRAVRYPDATHWLPHEQPEAVVREIHGFFGLSSPGKGDTIRSPTQPIE